MAFCSQYYRAFARVDLGAIEHNLNELKGCIKKGVKTFAVVKADAYGHGAIPVAQFLEKKVDGFAVATADEALELRGSGIASPILVLSYVSPARYAELICGDIAVSICDFSEAALLSDTAEAQGKVAKVHISVDTGMGRIGFLPDEYSAEQIKSISKLGGVRIEGLFSHYACADSDNKSSALKQAELFRQFINMLGVRGVNIPLKHISNSAATMELSEQFDMCRLGIALYGIYPSAHTGRDKVRLIPAMEVVSHIIHLKTLERGDKIGYGHTYEAKRKMRIATVAIGYADGYNRCLSGRGVVLIRGVRAAVVGRICMDQMMVDVTDIPDVKLGDEALILGKDGKERISAEDIGIAAHSFSYEVLCNFSKRVVRIYCNSNN